MEISITLLIHFHFQVWRGGEGGGENEINSSPLKNIMACFLAMEVPHSQAIEVLVMICTHQVLVKSGEGDSQKSERRWPPVLCFLYVTLMN